MASLKRFHEAAHPYLDTFSLFLGSAALAYAAKQKRDAHHLKNKTEQLMEETTNIAAQLKNRTEQLLEETANIAAQLKNRTEKLLEETTNIAGSLSTRYVGLFPDNMNDIVQVIGKAESELRIMCDIAAYGHYSRPEAFLEYFQGLEWKARNQKIKIRIIAYDRPTGRSGHQSQFDGEKGFTSERANPRFSRYFDDVHPELNKPENYHDFDELMMSQEQMYENRLRNFCHVASANEPLRVFLWLADEKEVVFCFENAGKRGTREISFRTRDVSLIKTFKDLFEQHWDTFDQHSMQTAASPIIARASAVAAGDSQPTTPAIGS